MVQSVQEKNLEKGEAKMKRSIIALLLAAVLVMAGVMTGCQQGGNQSSTASPSGETQPAATQPAATQPASSGETQTEPAAPSAPVAGQPAVVGNGETLKVALQGNSLITDYDDNYLTKLLEAALNVNLEMEILPAANGDFRTAVSMMLADGSDLPDVIMGAFSNDVIFQYGQQGLLLDLKEYRDDPAMSPNWNALPEEGRELIMSQTTAPDGGVYGLGSYAPRPWNMSRFRMYVNTDFLTALGKEVPTTIDEFYNLLVAIKEGDPNGNGQADEIPFYCATSVNNGGSGIWALMNAYTFFNGGLQNGGLALSDDGTVYAPFATDEWREGLEFCRKLCEEGLMPEDVFTVDTDQYGAILDADVPIVGVAMLPSFGYYSDSDADENLHKMQIIAPLTGPDGVCYTPTIEATSTIRAIIPATCEHPELAWSLLEYQYDKEISTITRYGQKDYDWTDDPAVLGDLTNSAVESGIITKDDLIAIRYKTDEDVFEEENNRHWHQTNLFALLVYDVDLIEPFSEEDYVSQAEIFFYKNYVGKVPKNMLPVLVFNEDELEFTSEASTNIVDYVRTATAEFVTGQRNLDDAGWQKYLDELETYELSDYLSVCQDAYDRIK